MDKIFNKEPKKGIIALIDSMEPEQLNHKTKIIVDTALSLALKHNPDKEIIQALAKKSEVNFPINDNHDTALTSAIFNKHQHPPEGILALIDSMETKQLNHITKKGNTALLLALEKNKDKLNELAEVLLKDEVIFKDNLEAIFGKRPFEIKKEETTQENNSEEEE